jgi:hypothetical protein
MRAYMKAFGLNFGCFDFIVPKGGGEPIFLEMNPNGQWLWVQSKTGQDIGEAIAGQLIRCSYLDYDLVRFHNYCSDKKLWERACSTR